MTTKGPEVPIWRDDLFGSNSSLRYRLMPTHCCLLSLLPCQHDSVRGCKSPRPWLKIPYHPTSQKSNWPGNRKKRNYLAGSVRPQCGCIKGYASKGASDGCDNSRRRATTPRIPLDDTVSKLLITPTNSQNQTSLLDFRVHLYFLRPSRQLSVMLSQMELTPSPLSPTPSTPAPVWLSGAFGSASSLALI